MSKWSRRKSKSKRWIKAQLIREHGAVCAICTKPFEGGMKTITLDHIVPASKGGLDTVENYQLAHYECNQLKSDMTPDEWEWWLKEAA